MEMLSKVVSQRVLEAFSIKGFILTDRQFEKLVNSGVKLKLLSIHKNEVIPDEKADDVINPGLAISLKKLQESKTIQKLNFASNNLGPD